MHPVIHTLIHPSIHPSTHPSIHPFFHSGFHSFIVHVSIHLLVCFLFVHFVYSSFIHACMHAFMFLFMLCSLMQIYHCVVHTSTVMTIRYQQRADRWPTFVLHAIDACNTYRSFSQSASPLRVRYLQSLLALSSRSHSRLSKSVFSMTFRQPFA